MSRESHTLLLVHDAQFIYGSIGIHDPFQQPDVVRRILSYQIVEARVGQRPDGTFLVGDALRDAVASDADIDVFYPIENGTVRDWSSLEALWYVQRSHPGTMSSWSVSAYSPRRTHTT